MSANLFRASGAVVSAGRSVFESVELFWRRILGPYANQPEFREHPWLSVAALFLL